VRMVLPSSRPDLVLEFRMIVDLHCQNAGV
jgi:hypothetical protein